MTIQIKMPNSLKALALLAIALLFSYACDSNSGSAPKKPGRPALSDEDQGSGDARRKNSGSSNLGEVSDEDSDGDDSDGDDSDGDDSDGDDSDSDDSDGDNSDGDNNNPPIDDLLDAADDELSDDDEDNNNSGGNNSNNTGGNNNNNSGGEDNVAAAPKSPETQIYRLRQTQSGDHMLSGDSNEGVANFGYVLEGDAFKVFEDQIAETKAIYRCLVETSGDHFTSEDANCEGQKPEGRIGYIWISQKPNTKPLIRCNNTSVGDHMTTLSPEECDNNGYIREKTIGYTIP